MTKENIHNEDSLSSVQSIQKKIHLFLKYIFGIAIVLIFTSLHSPLFSQSLVKHDKPEFAISVPIDWEEIPNEALVTYAKNISELAPDAPVQRYDYGFQAEGAEFWLAHPYILIQVNYTGRLTKKLLHSLPSTSIDDYVDELGENMKNVASDLSMGKMYYDKEANIVWMRVKATVLDVGEIEGLNAMILTEKGFINAAAYSMKEDFTGYETLFRSIQMSISPIQSLKYKPRFTDNFPSWFSRINWATVIGKVLAGAIIGGIIFLFQSLKKDES
jgi:hypothetical protein